MHVRVIETGHYKLAFELDRLRAFLPATAFEQDVVHLADAADLSIADSHSLSPRMRRVIGVNPSVDVISRVRSFLCDAGFRVEGSNEGDDKKREDEGTASSAWRPDFHRDFSSPT